MNETKVEYKTYHIYTLCSNCGAKLKWKSNNFNSIRTTKGIPTEREYGHTCSNCNTVYYLKYISPKIINEEIKDDLTIYSEYYS